MGNDKKPGTNQNCRCHSETLQETGNIQVSQAHLEKLNSYAQQINAHLQLVNLPMNAGTVLQLLLNQHLEKIGNELVEFAALKSNQTGQQIQPKTITFTLETDRKKIH